VSNKATKPQPAKKKKPAAKSKSAGKTNDIDKSLVKCEVKMEFGEWISPDSCKTFYIDEDAKFPSIIYEIKTDEEGPFEWSWEIKWPVLACPQKQNKTRFKPKTEKTFSESESFKSDLKKWTAELNKKTIGGDLTIKVKVGAKTFVRKTLISGKEPGEKKINDELDTFSEKYPNEIVLAKKIFKQESKFKNFYSDERPLVSFDNGYGLGQATTPAPSYEQVWDWKKHVKYIVTQVIKEKRAAAKKYLDTHGSYNDEQLNLETLVYYNGANFHYYVWDSSAKKWIENSDVLCDPDQSNTGWNMSLVENKGKSLKDLRDGKGTKPVYTGRCYAEHINNQK
jgi:hypothetical protein